MITKEEFLRKYNISEALFQSAEISWEALCVIYEDFKGKVSRYEGILDNFVQNYLKNINKDKKENEKVRIHSIRSRVKDPEHLIEKIIRRKQDNQNKYKMLDATNYEKFITDLIGIRCLLLFKEDWESFHRYLLSKFENNAKDYIRDSLRDFDDNEKHFYIAENPKVHIRNGDKRELYDKVLSPDYVLDGKAYRSVHYIIKYRGIYLEIQVRTLFEEGWGEVDHAMVYPYYKNDPVLKEYTELLNRLTGLADEMSGFFYRLKILETEYLKKETQSAEHAAESAAGMSDNGSLSVKRENIVLEKKTELNTCYDCLKAVLDE